MPDAKSSKESMQPTILATSSSIKKENVKLLPELQVKLERTKKRFVNVSDGKELSITQQKQQEKLRLSHRLIRHSSVESDASIRSRRSSIDSEDGKRRSRSLIKMKQPASRDSSSESRSRTRSTRRNSSVSSSKTTSQQSIRGSSTERVDSESEKNASNEDLVFDKVLTKQQLEIHNVRMPDRRSSRLSGGKADWMKQIRDKLEPVSRIRRLSTESESSNVTSYSDTAILKGWFWLKKLQSHCGMILADLKL